MAPCAAQGLGCRRAAPPYDTRTVMQPLIARAPATLRNDLYERLVDRLRHAEQYAEACRATVGEALVLLEAAKREEADDA